MNVEQYKHMVKRAREDSIEYGCIVIMLSDPYGKNWTHRDFKRGDRARRYFNHKAMEDGFGRFTPVIMARNGIIMAQRGVIVLTDDSAAEAAEGDE